jgi:hypothetical protein
MFRNGKIRRGLTLPAWARILCKSEHAENLEAELRAGVGLAREPRFARAKRRTGFAA